MQKLISGLPLMVLVLALAMFGSVWGVGQNKSAERKTTAPDEPSLQGLVGTEEVPSVDAIMERWAKALGGIERLRRTRITLRRIL